MIDFFIGLFLANLIAALFSTRLYRLYLWYGLNSLSLGMAAVLMGLRLHDDPIIVSGVLTILLKGMILPYVFKAISQKFAIERNITPEIKVQYSIILVPALMVFTFYLAEPVSHMIGHNANYIAISISSFFLALLLILEHGSVAPKVIGFLMMENALFLLGTTATEGMPMLVELGIFFDLLMAIVIVNLLFSKEVSRD
jgi:hydrogenase-4 component E